MAAVNALAGEGVSTPVARQPTEAATVSNTPASLGDDVYVILDSLPGQPVGPILGWRNSPEERWPKRGGLCAVARSSDGNHWFVGWEAP